jgi:hypothetical protein
LYLGSCSGFPRLFSSAARRCWIVYIVENKDWDVMSQSDNDVLPELTTIMMNTWLLLTREKNTFSPDDVESDSLPRAEISTSILSVTDATQDASKLHVVDLRVYSVGDTGLEIG